MGEKKKKKVTGKLLGTQTILQTRCPAVITNRRFTAATKRACDHIPGPFPNVGLLCPIKAERKSKWSWLWE